ncbi:ribonuclease HII [Flavobacterium sp. CS20]|uniref:ribonuclease HII n=1 Tax=Flavobacterium sp. CS20 TaxID=2775246 RepID=UPI001B3A279A|nr:ribonuclease HII [Flavobacterium sp. CS20]QTY27006.1 ribonuclease HII [Flavobacterium sp. CS20]
MLKHRIITDRLECGTDEAGRGCLAGPVTAKTVILPADFSNSLINDSKQLSLKKRESLKSIIKKEAIAYGIAHVFPDKIDKINILNASILAMHKAIEQLSPQPEFILVDGNRFKNFKNINHECIIKGDAKYLNIAMTSVLAKTSRDEFMLKLHQQNPKYHWKQNKGYPTKQHREAIQTYGVTSHHRQSFKLLPDQLKLNFEVQ